MGFKLRHVLIVGIILFAFGLRLWRTDNFEFGHLYYSATAVNMLESPKNFFFLAADAGGVTVDKTPISLWLQSLSVAFIGVSGFSLIIVSIFCNSLSIAVLYRMISREFGYSAGLVAALVLATTPISISVDRTNVADSVLYLSMLIATWGFLWAIRQPTMRHVMIAAALMGVAFNVKMLQAFVALPALYGAYLFGASGGWWLKVRQMIAATLVLIFVAASWLTVVELVPKDQRPYIGSTRNNSTLELVFGYSALFRFLGAERYYELLGEEPVSTQSGGASPEIGSPGLLRFFQKELGNELSWLLPFAAWSMIFLLTSGRLKFPLSKEHRAVMVWGGWLLPGIFVMSNLQFLHAFYLATLAPPLAALVGIGYVYIIKSPRLIAYATLISTVMFQLFLVTYYDVQVIFFVIALGVCLGLLMFTKHHLAYLLSLLLIPVFWGIATAQARYDLIAPTAYAGQQNIVTYADLALNLVEGDYAVTDILQRNDAVKYDLVVSNQGFGSEITMRTNLRILYLGGFTGKDPIYTLDEFISMVDGGEVGFVLSTGQHPEMMQYVAAVCEHVRDVIPPYVNPRTSETTSGIILYQCE